MDAVKLTRSSITTNQIRSNKGHQNVGPSHSGNFNRQMLFSSANQQHRTVQFCSANTRHNDITHRHTSMTCPDKWREKFHIISLKLRHHTHLMSIGDFISKSFLQCRVSQPLGWPQCLLVISNSLLPRSLASSPAKRYRV